MRWITFVPSTRTASRAKIICPSLNSPTKSKHAPSLSTHVCFHLPARVSKNRHAHPAQMHRTLTRKILLHDARLQNAPDRVRAMTNLSLLLTWPSQIPFGDPELQLPLFRRRAGIRWRDRRPAERRSTRSPDKTHLPRSQYASRRPSVRVGFHEYPSLGIFPHEPQLFPNSRPDP